jgi:hypothetical protein
MVSLACFLCGCVLAALISVLSWDVGYTEGWLDGRASYLDPTRTKDQHPGV